jgi:hypothetical protein
MRRHRNYPSSQACHGRDAFGFRLSTSRVDGGGVLFKNTAGVLKVLGPLALLSHHDLSALHLCVESGLERVIRHGSAGLVLAKANSSCSILYHASASLS